MSTSQINITLGTAGHIDHGKTTLIKCLTGCDTDFLKIEKQRGMSIELGFAPCVISDMEVGIVDVPGHENFIKTMVAGATGIDGVIFVIAADDGVMPQTREHLDILTLLGVKEGIVALTKVDAVPAERTAKVTAEIKNYLTGTFLQDSPILPVSGITGQGFPDFLDALKEMVTRIKPRTTEGVFRMPIEKTFSIKGYGSVVTGIPVAGQAKTGDELILLPQMKKGRIKAIQVYSKNSDTVRTGQCAAVNVPQWDYRSIKRGDVVTVGKYFKPEQWYLAALKVLPFEKTKLKNAMKIRLHTGTTEVVASMYLMEGDSILPGEESIVQFRLDSPTVAAPNDPFVIRTLSPARTVAGGRFIEAAPKKLKRSHPEIIADLQLRLKAVQSEKSFIEYSIKTADRFIANTEQISLRTKVPLKKTADLIEQLAGVGSIIKLAHDLFTHSESAALIKKQLLDTIENYHSQNPDSPGILPSNLLEKTRLPKELFDAILDLMLTENSITCKKDRFASPTHKENFDDTQVKLNDKVESLFLNQPFSPPKFDEIIAQTKITDTELQNTLRILTEQQKLTRVDKDMLFHSTAIEKAKQLLTEHIQKEGLLESVKFKYLLDTTRKFAIPLLDYMDKIGVTRRAGNTRYLKK